MAERNRSKVLNTEELLIHKLRETFDERGTNQDEGSNVWVMVVAARSYQPGEEGQLAQTADTLTPTHRVRVVLRTTDNHNLNPYVDGSDFYLAIDEQQQTAEFVWEEDSFADAPLLHGSEVLTAIRWASELSNTLLSVTIEDPFQINDSPLPSTTTSPSLNGKAKLDDLPF
ncbi:MULTISPECIES: hypothetical protein [unclassified Paenibacillus]|uniref:hypothetical protein n=1 Tax=unclassified Paenibacillus TaxID=185978 RepID=UPI0024767E79|nr:MULTISPECIES: hypothetical protein [unclassified Paenibacillus]MDH6429051.1 hypothetical protein [Paenibacillus sp. PastH-4]MDH6445256.1 hypothetical protein [Paenibacillus sp. PastF-4]MDH6529146.1 hypothetical protein [Paenibacillus sp. PastH-3]